MSRRAGAAALTLSLAAAALGAVGVVAVAPGAGAAATSLSEVWVRDNSLGTLYANGGITESFSTPAVADLNGDGTAEVVTAGLDGDIVARTAGGSTLWSRHLADAAIQSSPAVEDMDGDGDGDVVVGAMNGRVFWLRGNDGAVVRQFADVAPPVCPGGTHCKPRGFFGTPAIGDITGDGVDEIVVTSIDHQVYAWRKDGSTVFRRYVLDTIFSSPVLADLDGDAKKEVIFGGDQDGSGSGAGGYIWVLRNNGTDYGNYPKFLSGQVIWSTPALVDLDGNHRLDIVVGTGLNFPGPAGSKVYAFTGTTGQSLAGWPVATAGRVMASPAVGNLDGDASPEVAVVTEGGWVYAFNADGSRRWSPVCNASPSTACRSGYPTHGGASIADVDNDGAQEVVAASDKNLRVFSGATGAVEDSWSLGGGAYAPASPPSIASVGGQTWIAQSTVYESGNGGGRNSGDSQRTWVLTTGTALGSAAWPTFKRTMARVGLDEAGTEPWYPFADPSGFVTQQYHDFLGRAPDQGGHDYWVGLLTSGRANGARLVELFLGSREFGSVVAPIARLHFGFRGAPPASSAQLWSQLDARRGGATLVEVADTMAADYDIDSKTDAEFVLDTYVNTRGHRPSAAQQSSGENQLDDVSRGEFLVSHSESAWAKAFLDAEVDVTMTYVGMLQRVPDRAGFDYWVRQVEGGISINKLARQFQFSGEYAARFRS